MLKLLLVGAGGFAGAIARYLVSGWVYRFSPLTSALPVGTLAVNVGGCLLIGFLHGLVETRQLLTPETRLLLFIGFLGSFTTYSTFGYETFNLARDGQLAELLLNIALHLLFGLSAVWFGHVISRIF